MRALFLLVLAAAQVGPARPFAEERQILDRHLQALARVLPDGATPVEDAALVSQIAAEAGLRNFEVGPPTVTESASSGQTRRTITGNATYPDTDRFFRAIQGSSRLIDVESLSLRPGEFGVRIEARLRFHHRPARAPLNPALQQTRTRDRTKGATREQAAKFARDEQLALDKSVALDEFRRRQTSPRLFLAETGAAFRDAVASLSFGSLDADSGRFSLRGVAAGMGAADAIERRLEGGFFRMREFTRTPKGGCYEFEAVGESFRAGPEAALPLPVDEPFGNVDGFCRLDRDAVAIAAPAGAFRASGSDSAGLTLRATDTDVADLAGIVEYLTREPFVVAEGTVGRVSVDFGSSPIDDALQALPVRIERVGDVRLLRPATGTSTAAAPPEESVPMARVSVRGKRLRGEDVIAAIAETDPSFAASGPPVLGTVSVFAREAPANDVRRAVVAALGFTESREENTRVLRTGSPSPEERPIVASNAPRFVFRARDLSVGELALAAIGRSSGESTAFVYSPMGEIVPLRAGDALSDGVVATVEAGALLVDTSEGPVRISLPAPPRPPR